MAQIDVSGIEAFLPIISFFLVFMIVYALLVKTKIFEHWFLQTFIPFLIATVFVAAVGPRDYILSIVTWFAILVVLLFFVLLFTGFLGEGSKSMHRGIVWVFIILLAIAFIISAIFVFQPYYRNNNMLIFLKDWVYDSKVAGALILLGVSAIASWILIKGGGKKDWKK